MQYTRFLSQGAGLKATVPRERGHFRATAGPKGFASSAAQVQILASSVAVLQVMLQPDLRRRRLRHTLGYANMSGAATARGATVDGELSMNPIRGAVVNGTVEGTLEPGFEDGRDQFEQSFA